MKPLSYFVASSLDGYIARPDGGIEWLFTDADYGYADFYASVDTILMGRRTFEPMLREGVFHYPGKRTFVFSTTLASTPFPEVAVVRGDPAELVTSLKRGGGGKIWLVGGSSLAAPLFRAGLVDELVVSFHPVTLGAGIPLFPPGDAAGRWRLLSLRTFARGLVQLTYERA
jgi:dihydrofolate reductase